MRIQTHLLFVQWSSVHSMSQHCPTHRRVIVALLTWFEAVPSRARQCDTITRTITVPRISQYCFVAVKRSRGIETNQCRSVVMVTCQHYAGLSTEPLASSDVLRAN